MNPTFNAVRAGTRRGRIELRQFFTTGEDLIGVLLPNIILITVMFFMRGANVPGIDFSLGAAALPGVLGMSIVFSGLIGIAGMLTMEREDGTLLRARAPPQRDGGLPGRQGVHDVWRGCIRLTHPVGAESADL